MHSWQRLRHQPPTHRALGRKQAASHARAPADVGTRGVGAQACQQLKADVTLNVHGAGVNLEDLQREIGRLGIRSYHRGVAIEEDAASGVRPPLTLPPTPHLTHLRA